MTQQGQNEVVAAPARAYGPALVTGVALVGVFPLFFPWWESLWAIWRGDTLRSIGALMPLACLALCGREWWRHPPGAGGTFWGLVPVVAALGAARWVALPAGLLFWGFASGVVLLFLGLSGWRRVAFALALFLFVNPVPWFVNPLFDLRLQFFGARVAQEFAHLLGIPVIRQNVALSFSGSVGMFVGASCNGLHSAVAMGYLSLVIGHVRGMGWRRHSLFVGIAVLLAYLVNLLRLCCLVLYNRLSMDWHFLQNYEQRADLVMGGCLFLATAWFLFSGFPSLTRPGESPDPGHGSEISRRLKRETRGG